MGLSRRNILIGLGGIVAGGGALVGTGAFTSVQAERTVNVSTAGDSGAFLGLQQVPNSANSSEYASVNDGTLEVTIGEDSAGVNLNAITKIDEVFRVVNNGTQPVVIYFEEDPNGNANYTAATDIGARADQLQTNQIPESQGNTSNGIKDKSVADLSAPSPPDQNNTDYGELGVKLGVGKSLDVGFYLDTSDNNLNDGLNESTPSSVEADEFLMQNLAIWADANAAQNGNHQFVEANTSS